MHIVLLILKIIGAILGGLLGLVLFLLFLVLFIPLRYHVHGVVQEDTKVKVSIHWLLHLIHVSILYQEKKTKFCLRIVGIPLKQNRKKKEQDKKKKTRKQEEESVHKKTDKEEKQEEVKEEVKEEKKEIPLKNVRIESTEIESEKEKSKSKSSVKQKKEFHPIQKIKELWQKQKDAIAVLRIKWVGIKQKKRNILTKKEKIFTFIKEEGTKNTFRKGKKALWELIRYIGPRKVKGYLKFGTGDPCQTGQILGGISVAYAYFNPKFKVYPDFEEKKLEADLKAHGRIRIIRFLFVGGRLYFDKEVKKCIADFKQLKEE